MYLAMYDLSGIQDFIFQTNRLKEIAGASYLVSRALFANVPELAGESPDAWRTRGVDGFQELGDNDARTVYVGGGNALVAFGGESRYLEFTRALKRRVFEQTGGALRICAALTNAEGKRLKECMDELQTKLGAAKAMAPTPLTARGFSVDALDNETDEPVLYFEDALNDRGEAKRFLPRSAYLKLGEFQRQENGKGSYTSPLLEVGGAGDFESDLDRFFARDGVRGKRYLAIVHIDGNTMGQKISGFIDHLNSNEGDLAHDLVAMRDMSKSIGGAYLNALEETIGSIYGDCKGRKRRLPFRPIVADGDDITLICRSEKAFGCVEEFVRALNSPGDVTSDDEDSTESGLPKPQEYSVGAGIAFCRVGYPFSTAYGIAEQLCGNAKKAAIRRRRNDLIAPANETAVSSIDFHVCSGELTTDIADFRERNLVTDGGQVALCKRPYHFPIAPVGDGEEGIDYSFGSFRELVKTLIARSAGESPWIARSKLKGLRDSYSIGQDAAELYGEMIEERDIAMQKSGAKEMTAERRKLVECLAEPYEVESRDASPKTYARLFDALDALDLCEAEEPPGAAGREKGGTQ